MKKTFWLALVTTILVASLVVTKPVLSQETIPMTITEISVYDGLATDVNESGQVVGYHSYYIDGNLETHAFLWDEIGGVHDLGLGEAYSINDLEQVVGGYRTDIESPYSSGVNAFHAALWRNDLMQDVHTLGVWWDSIAYDINTQGQVVGCLRKYPCSGWGCWFPAWDGAFIWTEETGMQDLSALAGETLTCAYDINENGQVVGDSANGPFVWSETSGIQYITNNPYDHAYSINDANQVAGIVSGDAIIYVWSPSNGMTLLNVSAGGSWYVLINDLGQVVGSTSVGDESRAFVWDPELSLLYLPHLSIEVPMSYGGRSNNNGQIAGASNGHPVLWTVEFPPPTPQKQIALIDTKVDALVNSGVLDQGEGTALISKLDAATSQVNKGNNKAARNILGAFINTVDAFVNSGRLTSTQAQPLINATNIAISKLP
jgi:probable HAF family extracellular repeat protein